MGPLLLQTAVLLVIAILMISGRHVVDYNHPLDMNHHLASLVYNQPDTVYNPPEYEYNQDCHEMMENYKKARTEYGYRDLQASHFMLPDEPLLALATRDEYKYRQTFPGNSRSFRVGKTVKNLGLKNATIKKDLVQNNEEISQCYGHQSTVNAPIQVNYYCNGDDLYWTEKNPYDGKVVKYMRGYDDEKKTMHYQVSHDNTIIANHVFDGKVKKKGLLAAAIAIPIAVAVPLGVISLQAAFLGMLVYGGYAILRLVVFRIILFFICKTIAVITGATVTATAVGGLGLLGLIGLIRSYKESCIYARTLYPCTCSCTVTELGTWVSTLTCPQGASLVDLQGVFNRITVERLDRVVINIPPNASTIPPNILGMNKARVIQLIGSSGSLNPITINVDAFRQSESTTTLFILEQLNLINLDYSFMKNFNILTTVKISSCTNNPSPINPPKNLPENLGNLVEISVDGVNIFPLLQLVIDPAVIAPCTRTFDQGSKSNSVICPVGTTLTQIQTAFSKIKTNIIVNRVIINIPSGVDVIPANMLSKTSALSINLIGPKNNPLTRLTIDDNAFTSSASRTTHFFIQEIDAISLAYRFLAGFNALTEVQLNQSINTPNTQILATSLPNLPKLVSFLVDGVSIYKKPAARFYALL